MSRRTHRPRRVAAAVRQLPWQRVHNPYPPVEVLSADQVEAVIDAALTVLETKGFRYLEDESRSMLLAAGAEPAGPERMLRLDRGLVREQLRHAPRGFPLRARNPGRDLWIGDNEIVFVSVGGPAFCSDLDRGRRPGTYAEHCEFLKLVQSLNIIHQEGGGGFEAMDLPPESRHLDLYLAQLTLLDKNAQAYALGRERTLDCLEMTAIALGTTREQMEASPAVLAIINTNSPMQLDVPMTEAIIELARHRQVACITPFTLAGSMSPATLAGTLAQQTAEVLAVVTLSQIVRPGAPVMYGSFASNVDMQSGAPALGTPEYARMALASGQIARRLGLPFRSSNTTTSNCVDAQSAYESQMSVWSSILAHTNLLNHAAGWLEGGLTASFEKLVVDAEMLQMMVETLRPIVLSDDEFALDAIAEVPPGGHHFGTAHTLARYETAFYQPLLSDRQNFERWQEGGSKDAAMRANEIWKQLLKDYEKPANDPAVEEALSSYVEKRKRAIAARLR
ncbi:MAG: trimethylamine methyltransferase family protein [Gammaproteobacteria bacterium]|nr:trimethylamine methyltransferase family protein [Gammaproteobacteria bacterium]MDH4254964.1 trimethylamine methyltransferase family protein [Gammaproteobacteria bacterium]MDH5310221.1 trimethylamine methyltransferase family protein [Gammaproteobacteria bacterium]